MNMCQFCGAVSTIHLTEIVNNSRREMHLCDACGRERDLIPEASGPQLNLPALLHLLIAQPDPVAEPHEPPKADPN